MIHWGKIHEYLGMEVDYSMKGKVKIGIIEYVENMIKNCPEKINFSTDSAVPSASDG
jgi:hypothetical protein